MTYEYEFGNKFKKIINGAGIYDIQKNLSKNDFNNMIKFIDINYGNNDKCIISIRKILNDLSVEDAHISILPDIITIYMESAEINGINININMNTEFKILTSIFCK